MKRFVLICLLLFSSTACALDPLVRVDVTVVGEEGVPVEDVSVRGDFAGVVSGSGNVDLESTNEDGVASVIGRSHFPVRVIAKKKNFYTTTMEVNTVELVDGKQVYKNKKVRMVLREKRNPIPLYAKRFTGGVPVANQWIGFDLEKGDWVSPYGAGIVSDLLFHYEGRAKGFFTAKGSLKLKFSSEFDGLVDVSAMVDELSEMKVTHEAPKNGYGIKKKIWYFDLVEGVPGSRHISGEDKYYFFRVRAVPDTKGIAQANYAKFYHDINFDPRVRANEVGVARIRFMYFFNPEPNDPNLEFDLKRNLFEGLNYDERVNSP